MKLTIDEVLNKMIYSSVEEKEEASCQLELRGAFQYNRIIELLTTNNLKASYISVSSLYKYDKRLRFNLYKYVSYMEERLRAILGNYYDSTDDKIKLNKYMQKELDSFSCVSEYVETLDFGGLEKVICKNKNVFDGEFDITNHFSSNIKAIKVLRDKLSHHQFLLMAPLIKCSKYGDKSLKSNILNLRDYLGENYKKGFTKCINDCLKDLDIPDPFKIEI